MAQSYPPAKSSRHGKPARELTAGATIATDTAAPPKIACVPLTRELTTPHDA